MTVSKFPAIQRRHPRIRERLATRLDSPDMSDFPDEDDALDADFPLGDGTADTATLVYCPYCGEPNEITLDPGGGESQEYVEDCQVCCQPWRVLVSYDAEGHADAWVEPADGR